MAKILNYLIIGGVSCLLGSLAWAQPKDIGLDFTPVPAHRHASDNQNQIVYRLPKTKSEVLPNKAELESNLTLTNKLLNRAIVDQDWPNVSYILSFYSTIDGYDIILYQYAQGALWHKDYNYAKAIAMYQQILQSQPELYYVRLSLAKMQIENKAYKDAAQNLQQVLKSNAVQPAKQEAQYFLDYAKKVNRATLQLSLGLQWSNNVNDSSANKYFYYYFTYPDREGIWAVLIPKNAEDMPKSDTGLKMGLNYLKPFQLRGNHSAFVKINTSGIRYFNQQEFGLNYLNLSAGYKWANYKSSFTIEPAFMQIFEAGNKYSNNLGVSFNYENWLRPSWKINAIYDIGRKKYADPVNLGYEGVSNRLDIINQYFFDKTFIYLGVSAQHNNMHSAEQTSNNVGYYAGFGYAVHKNLMLQTSIRQNYKHFAALYSNFLNEKRHDRETIFNISLNGNQWQLFGFTPELSITRTLNKSTIYIAEKKDTSLSLVFNKIF